MSELSHGAPDLDTRLAEIDRRLREIQADLLPEREPRPSRPPAGDEPPESPQATEEPQRPAEPRTETEEPPTETAGSHRGRSGPLATMLERTGAERREGPQDRRERPPDRGEEPPPPPPRASPPPPASLPPPAPTDQLAALTGLHVKLLSSMRDLLEAYQFVLTRTPAPEPPAAEAGTAEVSLSAGPFASIEAVRAFERTLAGVPGVREVAVRGYESGDRAIFDVQLSERTV
jgi:hypothetical protein